MLRAAEGATNRQIAAELGLSDPDRQAAGAAGSPSEGLAGLPTPALGPPAHVDEATVQRVIAMTLEPPPEGETHWSVRRLARRDRA